MINLSNRILGFIWLIIFEVFSFGIIMSSSEYANNAGIPHFPTTELKFILKGLN